MWGGKPNPNWNTPNQTSQSAPAPRPVAPRAVAPRTIAPRTVAPLRPAAGAAAAWGGAAQTSWSNNSRPQQQWDKQQWDNQQWGNQQWDEQQQRKTELQQKREEENAKRAEHAASIIVRKVIQRVRVVQPEKFDELRTELETTLSDQLEKMGSMAEKIQQEAEKELLEAQARVDALNEKRLEEERQKAAEEVRRQQEQEKAEKFKKDIETLACDAEAKVGYMAAAETRLEEARAEGAHEVVLKAAQALEDMVTVAEKATADLAKGLSADLMKEMEFSQDTVAKLKKEFRPSAVKNAECKRTLAKISKKMREVKEREVRRASAIEKDKAQREAFAKFDSCGGGQLSRDDLRNFAKEQYSFQMEDGPVDRLHAKLRGKGVGVPFERFRRMRQWVAVERSTERHRQRLAQEAKLKAEVAATKTEMRALFEGADKALSEAAAEAAAADAAAKPLRAAARLAAADLRGHVAKAEELHAPGLAKLDKAKELADIAGKAVGEIGGSDPEVVSFRKQLVEDFNKRSKQVQSQLDRCSSVAKMAKQRVQRKEFAEMDVVRFQLVKAAGVHMAAKGLDMQQLYADIAKGAELGVDGFLAFAAELWEHLGDKVEESTTQSHRDLFRLTVGDEAALSQDRFLQMLQVSYKVVKPTMITEGSAVDSKSRGRLNEGEILHGLDCPRKEENSGVVRTRCRSAKDDTEGWVSVAGNKGTVFLEPCHKYLACLKETVVTAELLVSSETVRKLNKDELVEVLQFPTKEPTCDVMRVKAKAVADGVVGWISIAGNAGTSFLGPC